MPALPALGPDDLVVQRGGDLAEGQFVLVAELAGTAYLGITMPWSVT